MNPSFYSAKACTSFQAAPISSSKLLRGEGGLLVPVSGSACLHCLLSSSLKALGDGWGMALPTRWEYGRDEHGL